MKKLGCIALFLPFLVFAQPYMGSETVEINNLQVKAGSCPPANTSTFLELNNVSALIHTAGNLWQIQGQNFSQYEVPKGSGIMALFASALWLGGKDVNGQLKLAALRYRNGNDYWTGPLSIGNATIDSEQCQKYDKHFYSNQDEVREFDAWFTTGLLDQQNGTSLQSSLFPNYEIPLFIKDWPAHGDPSIGQDYYLAPFFDRDEDGNYDWTKGDYPWYDLENNINCRSDRTVTVFGDENLWWVINDKGNIHTETGGDPIGMEIRAQAFAFATNDQINNMTFYNYELINRSTQTLQDTYFGAMVDVALGGPFDDYVGCDVSRGLGYSYNGTAFDADEGGFLGYGNQPAAVGVDFFEGPYQDDDGIDNAFGIGPNEALNGIGYGDGIIDNERFGMCRFLYYNNTGGSADINTTDPINAIDYYNYLSGFWKDGTRFLYGGNGHTSGGGNPAIEADFMFPGDTDPLGWGTGGVPQPEWTEQTAGNQPFDRRFAQSAGPFVLKPGAVNNITIGVVWSRSGESDPFASVETLRIADDKAQALFENCFRVIDGPHAPDLTAQELENEVILMLSNPNNSNNKNEDYEEKDPFIVGDEDIDRIYRFQGYQVFQLSGKDISVSDLSDIDKARLVFQCDIKDSVSKLINYEFNEQLQIAVPSLKVDGENTGIRHSVSLTQDAFATGTDKKLVNFKRYYYMAISYAHNNYKTYDPSDPNSIDGQQKPYLSSRKAPIGEVRTLEVIPHSPSPEANGTFSNVGYGFEFPITRIDGAGNGGRVLEISEESEKQIIENGSINELTYAPNGGPIAVKVIDPLNIKNGDFKLKFYEDQNGRLDDASWTLYELISGDSITSDQTINIFNEQIIPEWGISITLEQTDYVLQGPNIKYTAPLDASIEFADSSKQWLTGLEDNDAYFYNNWIRSGTFQATADECNPSLGDFNPCNFNDRSSIDDEKTYPQLLNGTVSPYGLVGYQLTGMPVGDLKGALDSATINSSISTSQVGLTKSIDLVITKDKSKWTKAAVIETGRDYQLNQNQGTSFALRNSASLDIDGNEIQGEFGCSYFPGYAIDLESGKRLNIAFGENSFLSGENGADMKWNPTSNLFNSANAPKLGGMHTIYVFSADEYNNGTTYYNGDLSKFTSTLNQNNLNQIDVTQLYRSCMWVLYPILAPGSNLLDSDVRIKLRVNRKYEAYTATGENNALPLYGFSTKNYITEFNRSDILSEVLTEINVVPNPYNAFSEYENGRLDTRIKITNLPERCTMRIYNLSGKLIRTFQKDNPLTFQDWNLRNVEDIPVASGTYLIHITVPNIGEVVLKSFVTMRQPDFDNF